MVQTRSKHRKDEILALAMQLLQTQGFENFSYQDLSSALGITKASIHHHFPRKEDLGVALCQLIKEWHERRFSEARREMPEPWSRLDAYLRWSLEYAQGENKICPLSSLQSDINLLPSSMCNAIAQLDEHEIQFIAELLEQGRQQGVMSFKGETRHQALLLVLACKGALQYSRIHGLALFDQVMNQYKHTLQP
ncbi:TetR/AcrR family transcriptional regulator [Simiduia aestuariiviva]|uniref:TetR/AcrR family transcriptional repressor of nem operon n=1 Tax=Simiduia aestuariiviva TaxID=1510459 RepID=A0A839UJP1_9GAMM|nr:TetR/AcrR family transcriptional regulator [Simiduia aestuariiviva]MBB3167803.1 TetR/AcrR family transcriptional repressor of nem operon [Simiduia aestuariiviva]